MTFTVRPSIHYRICTCRSTHALIKRIFVAGFIVLAALLGGANRWPLHAQAVCPSPYIVQAGDSWTGIAKKRGVNFPDLRATNAQLWSQRGVKIQPGDTMALPMVAELPKTPAEAAPVATIRAYYAALAQALRQSGDLSSAYAYFSSVRRAAESLARFRKAYAQTTQVEIQYIKLVEQQATTAFYA